MGPSVILNVFKVNDDDQNIDQSEGMSCGPLTPVFPADVVP